jgi:hypothetical protein
MKRKTFLFTSLFLASITMGQAQNVLFSNGFEDDNADNTATGWYEYINNQTGDTREINSAAANSGSFGCHFYNDAATMGNTWQRAIKFRNIQPKEGTSYRLSFYLRGDNQYVDTAGASQTSKAQVALMCGEENADVPFLAADSTQFTYSISDFTDGDFKKYTLMFFYANAAIQKAYYLNHKSTSSPDSELADKFFAAINLYNPGDYYLDDVEAVESTIAGAYFNQDMIKIDFGYATNVATLAKTANTGKLQLPNSCVKVTLNGNEVNVVSVEVQSDGYLYIFLGDTYPESADDKVVVSFTNPTDADQLLYTSSLRPNSASQDKVVLNFSDETAEYDENLNVTSVAYDPPTLVTAEPEDGSFDLPTTTNTFTLNFDKPVNLDKASATLTGGSIKGESLTITPSTGFAQSVTLTRTGSEDLGTAEYTVNMTNIIGKLSYGDDLYNTVNLTYNMGTKVADPNDTAYVAWTDSFSVLGDGYIPDQGWTMINSADNTTFSAGTQPGLGPRMFKFGDGGDVSVGLYIRCGYAEYGLKDDHLLTLKAGKYQVHYNCFGWKATPTLKFELLDADDQAIVSRTDVCKPNVNGSKNAVTETTSITADVKIPTDGNYKLKWTTVDDNGTPNTSGMIEIMFGNCYVKYIPSTPGAYYKTMIENALDAAKVVVKNDDSTRYAGTAYTTLKETIAKYDGKAFTAPSAYVNGTAELNTAASTMTAHRKLIDTYDPMVAAAQTIIDTYAGTKYANDASYPQLQTIINIYNGQVLTMDDSLQTAIDTLTFYTNKCSNMCKYVIDDLNDRTAMAISTAKKVGISEDDADIVAAQTAITDNDYLVDILKYKIKARLYQNLADPNDTTFDKKTDPTTLEEYVDSIDMTCFIKNPNLYVTTYTNTDMSEKACPGWKISTGSGYNVSWSIGWSTYDVSATRPAEDAMLTNWAKSFDISQSINDLPAGVYSIKTGFGERVATDTSHPDNYNNYFYIVANADSDSIQAPYIGQSFPTNNMSIDNITITDGKLTIGAKAASDAHVFLNNFAIYLKAKAPNFDYATDVKGITETDNNKIKAVEYYDINGQKLNSMKKGITIIKWIYNDGSTVIQKKIIK